MTSLTPHHRTRLIWIIQAVDRSVERLENHNAADIGAALMVAFDKFCQGESGSRCISCGCEHAKQRIAERARAKSNVIKLEQWRPS